MSQENQNRFKDVLLEVNGPPCKHPNIKVTEFYHSVRMDTVIHISCKDCEMDETLMVDHERLRKQTLDFMKPRQMDPFKDHFGNNFSERR